MTEPKWVLIAPDDHAWLRERNAEDPDCDYRQHERYYVPESKGKRQWPLLVVCVLPRFRTREEKAAGRHRVSVAGSIKRSRDGWFEENYGIPASLLDDVAEMFTAFITTAKKG